ncbi:MAG: ribosome assembly RNA-binding protein YhbY [bacterium]
MMDLTEKHKKHLRKLGHGLKPVVMIAGDGLKDTVISAVNEALEHHELIKVRIRGEDKISQKKTLEDLCSQTGATPVATIGFVGLLFKRNKKAPKIDLPRR